MASLAVFLSVSFPKYTKLESQMEWVFFNSVFRPKTILLSRIVMVIVSRGLKNVYKFSNLTLPLKFLSGPVLRRIFDQMVKIQEYLTQSVVDIFISEICTVSGYTAFNKQLIVFYYFHFTTLKLYYGLNYVDTKVYQSESGKVSKLK